MKMDLWIKILLIVTGSVCVGLFLRYLNDWNDIPLFKKKE